MKIQCDVCDKDEAILYCVADEAALCAACDHRVHHANKLAGKHQRFSLLQPSAKQAPLCDICQERRAFLFCQQDRAILCEQCDDSIHSANEHISKHNRFLLTGVKLSATSALYYNSSAGHSTSSLTSVSASSPTNKNSQKSSRNKPSSRPSDKWHPFTQSTPSRAVERAAPAGTAPPPLPSRVVVDDKSTGHSQNGELLVNGNLGQSFSTSSISEYLMEMLPGWHVEDLLDSSSSAYGLCKDAENDVLPFWDADIGGNLSGIPPENMGSWVAQTQNYQLQSSLNMAMKENIKSSRRYRDDNSFAVPQVKPHCTGNKKSRTFW